MIVLRFIVAFLLIGMINGQTRRIKCADLEHLGGNDLACGIYCMIKRNAEDGQCNNQDECICENDNSTESSTNITPTEMPGDKVGTCVFGVGSCVRKCKKQGHKRGGWCDGGTFGVCRCRGKAG